MKEEGEEKHLTTNQGVPVTNNQNSLIVGERGPVLLAPESTDMLAG